MDGARDAAGRVFLMDLLSAGLTLISAHTELIRLKIANSTFPRRSRSAHRAADPYSPRITTTGQRA